MTAADKALKKLALSLSMKGQTIFVSMCGGTKVLRECLIVIE